MMERRDKKWEEKRRDERRRVTERLYGDEEQAAALLSVANLSLRAAVVLVVGVSRVGRAEAGALCRQRRVSTLS